MIALSLTRELKLFEGKIEQVLTKNDALSLAHALGQRRVTDAQLWTMILKAVSPSLTNKQLAARDVSQLVVDLNKVKLSSQKLYKQLTHYCVENLVLEDLADRNW